MHERPASKVAGRWFFSLRYATRAVIGTLRPTEQRRAITESRWVRHLAIGTIRPTEPGRKPLATTAGADPLAHYVEL